MTMQPSPPLAHLSADDYAARREQALAEAEALLIEWSVASIQRDFPRHVTRRDGYRLVRPGRWWIDGRPATSAEARRLNRLRVASGVASVRVAR